MSRQQNEAAPPNGAASSVDPAEAAKFAALAESWWDSEGDFKPLHRLNPTRLAFIRDRAVAHFALAGPATRPLAGLRVLDVGCGGGLLAEPLTRLGAQFTGIDATPESIAVARHHAAAVGLDIDYRADSAEALVAAGETYDLVVNMEVVEHVSDRDGFIATCCALVRPGGAMALSTINRTPKAYLMAIVGAEYLLRWLPRGTHDWRKFVRPSELVRALRAGGLDTVDLTGLVYNPLTDRWHLHERDLDVNYLLFAAKAQ